MTTSQCLVLTLMLAACNGGGSGDDSPPTPDAPGGAANATFTWTITQNGVAATCASADVDEVKIEATPETGVPVFHTFQCVLLPGSLTLPPARYAIVGKLYSNVNAQTRATIPAQALTVPASGTAPAMMFNFIVQ